MKESIQPVGRVTLKKGLLSAVLLLALIGGIVGSAQAGGIIQMENVQTGTVIEKDVFLSGQKPVLDGTVNGDVFAFGSEVAIKGDIDGSLFVIGDQVTLDGKVTGSVYSLALSFNQTATSSIERSLYILAVDLSTEKGSTIGRDLWTVALSANLRGDTVRDTKAVIGLLKIYRILRDGFNRSILGMSPSNLPINPVAVWPVKVAAHPQIQRPLTQVGSPADLSQVWKTAQAQINDVAQWLFLRLQTLVTFFLIGGLALWWRPTLFQRWADSIRNRPVPSMGYGLVVLINGFLLPFILLALIVGVVVAFFFLKLPSIGWIVFGGGLNSLGLAFTAFLVCTTYISKTIVAYLAGTLILNLIWPKAVKYKALPLLLGLILYVLIAQIPFIGWVTGFVFTLLGLGAMWQVWRIKPLPEDSSQVA
jgi:hypothetical protein